MEGGGALSLIVLLAVFGGIFYFLLIRPQRKKQQKHDDLVKNLKRGDKIVTAGGIHGEVTRVLDDSLLIEVEDGTVIRFQQDSVVETVSEDVPSEDEQIDELDEEGSS